MSQKTKIVATLGPATSDPATIERLMIEGVNVFRFNMKHNVHEWHYQELRKVRSIAKNLGYNIAVLADLKGPELRTAPFVDGAEKIQLTLGQQVIFGEVDIQGIQRIPFNELRLIEGIDKGGFVLIDDGKVVLLIHQIYENYLLCEVVQGRELGSRKSISMPNCDIKVPTLMKKDKEDVKFAVESGFDFVALSFVRDEHDITTLRRLIKKLGGHQKIVSKIETKSSLDNIDNIIKVSDVIMVARGDLGVEIPIERVPKVQEMLINKCREQYTPVIVATQMLLSMVNSPIPSRAEVSDIANSVMDKTDALMLSEESATGNFPVEAVKAMAKIARYNESNIYHEHDFLTFGSETYQEMILSAAIEFSNERHSKEHNMIRGYIVFSESGKSARLLSRFRTKYPIYAMSPHENVVKELAISYGVYPFHLILNKNPIINTRHALALLRNAKLVQPGDKMIVIFGSNVGEPEGNNTISIVDV